MPITAASRGRIVYSDSPCKPTQAAQQVSSTASRVFSAW
ncbi:DUF4124 domain-containing protein [Halioglobus sp. Uisw_031]